MDFLESWKNRRVLVTGGSGFIGKQLLALGAAAGVDLYNASPALHGPAGVTHFEAGLGDSERIRAIIDEVKPDGILHLAAGGVVYGSATLSDMLRVNAIGLQSLLEAALNAGLRPDVVIAGSGLEYGLLDRPRVETDPVEPLSPYGVSKAAASLVAGYYAQWMRVTVLRLFNVYGPGDKLPRVAPYVVERVRQGQPVELTAGEQVTDFTYVADAAEGFWRALALPPFPGRARVVNLASGRPIALRTFVETLATVLGEWGYTPQLRFGAKPYRPNEPMVYLADIGYMKQLFAWSPPTTLREGLSRMVAAALG